MESSTQPDIPALESEIDRKPDPRREQAENIAAIRREMEYLNKIGKRFVAANDRFQVHHALIAALQELYTFSACAILLKGQPFELSIIPRYPLSPAFLQSMIARITRAANVIGFPEVSTQEMAVTAFLDAPDEFAPPESMQQPGDANEVKDFVNVPLTVEDRIIGMLSLFDTHEGTFDAELLQLTTMIADYAAIALENVQLHERETALWKKAETERLRLELIISSMAEGLLITDTQGNITFCNPSARHLFSQGQVELLHEIPLKQMAKDQQAPWLKELAEILQQALDGHRLIQQEVIAGVQGENVPLTLNISAAPLDEAGRSPNTPIGVVTVLNDLTSSKQIEKLKDEFVSVASHELRTPLTAIKGYTQHLIRRIERRLRKAQQSSPMQSEAPENYDLRSLSIIQSQAEHLERLVKDLLDHSRLQWGNLNLIYTSFHLADVLTERIRLAQASADLHTIYLDLQAHETLVVADEKRISQVIGNLLDNAIKFSPQGGQVTIRMEDQGDTYRISVIDQGVGVSPAYYDHIFERFYRVRNSASNQYSGIGLGLYVSKAIIEAHGGRIGLTSQQGTGSTFYFTLPKQQIDES